MSNYLMISTNRYDLKQYIEDLNNGIREQIIFNSESDYNDFLSKKSTEDDEGFMIGHITNEDDEDFIGHITKIEDLYKFVSSYRKALDLKRAYIRKDDCSNDLLTKDVLVFV